MRRGGVKNKRQFHQSGNGICCSNKLQSTNKRKLELDNTREQTIVPVVAGALGTVLNYPSKETGRTENPNKNQNHPINSLIKISKNTQESTDETCWH